MQARAPTTLVKALKEEVGLPIHFHTHDTSGIAAASVLAAVEAGVDASTRAMDDERPDLAALPRLDRRGAAPHRARHRPRPRGDPQLSFDYWEAVRAQYAAFESDLRAGASEVYLHEMPGGQFTNLQASRRARWASRRAGTRSRGPTPR